VAGVELVGALDLDSLLEHVEAVVVVEDSKFVAGRDEGG
jgi:hypothetical protein